MKYHQILSFIVLLFGLFLCGTITAQTNKTTFKGVIIDESDLPVPGATIMILDPADSTLIQFGSSDAQGAFIIRNVAKGDFLMNVNFIAHAPFYQTITSGVKEETDLGRLKLEVESTVLNAVEVKAAHLPIEITKDTISYNADAFETQPNAVVEDLLKKLPGIEVAADGSIKAQGEDVQRVLVDGKEFFGDDPKMATKNLPAKALKKVKVYDKQSEMSEFTGVDDGTREKTIDLQLKEEFKKGLFGTAQAGYGTDERYNAKASLNRFTKTSQLSFLGQLNNINDQGFSWSDMMTFSGGMRGMGGGGRGGSFQVNSADVPFNDGSANGLAKTGAAGFNFNYQKNKNFNVRSSYFYNDVNNEVIQNVFRQNLIEDPFDTREDVAEIKKNHSHSAALNSDIQLDTTMQIQLNGRLGVGDGTLASNSFLQNLENTSSLLNQSTTLENNTADKFSLSGGATFMKRFGNKGRNVSVNGTMAKTENETNSELEALTEYFLTGNTEAINQFQNTITDDLRTEGQFSYTEPLRKRRFLEFNYFYSQLESDYNKLVKDITDSSSIVNPALSNNYTSTFQYHRPGVTFRYSGEVHNVNIGLNYQMSDLVGHLNLDENEIKQQYSHFLPRVTWRYDIGNGKNLRFNYSTRVNAPAIVQLSPVIDNSDPLRLYVGNPDLDAEYSHNLSFNFHSFSQFSSTNFFGSLNASFTKDRIITSRSIDDQFREVSTPINIDEESRYSTYLNYGRPLKPIHSRVSVNTNLAYTKTQNYINTELLDVNRWSRTIGLTISNLNSKVLEYNFGGEWTFTDNYYKVNESLNQNTLLTNYFVDATLTLWKKWKVQGSYDLNLYSSSDFAENQSLPLMEFSISRFILPKDKGQLKLSVFDALDENRGLSRSADINYIEEVRTNSIGRYAMLSFIYSLRGMGQEQGGFKMIERRH